MRIPNYVIAALMLVSTAGHTNTILTGTVWDDVARAAECKLDPLLLYSIALVESRRGSGGGTIKPHPLALRNQPSGSLYPETMSEAQSALRRFIQEDRLTDIGVMQVNYRWNGHRVDDPSQLLDLKTNIQVGASILCESMSSYPGDMRLAIGGYHTRNPKRKQDAIRYGEEVIYIWQRIGGQNI